MTDYILSIRPKWVQMIFSGKKTAEIRKSAPRALVSTKAPLRVWVYETKSEGGRGKLVGTFICRRIEWLNAVDFSTRSKLLVEIAHASCLTEEQLKAYKGAAGRIFAWKIEDVRRLREPMELNDVFPGRYLPPQSWAKAPAEPAIEGLT